MINHESEKKDLQKFGWWFHGVDVTLHCVCGEFLQFSDTMFIEVRKCDNCGAKYVITIRADLL